MKQYLLDTSVLLDLLLNRPPWAAEAAVIWDAHRHSQIRVFIAAFSLPNIFYIVRKQGGLAAARTAVQACLSTVDIAPIDQATLLAAQALVGSDFEDDLQIACALQAGVDAAHHFAMIPDLGLTAISKRSSPLPPARQSWLARRRLWPGRR
jgi:predicted nucleic acid-binding protein